MSFVTLPAHRRFLPAHAIANRRAAAGRERRSAAGFEPGGNRAGRAGASDAR